MEDGLHFVFVAMDEKLKIKALSSEYFQLVPWNILSP
jgi:hypothetical protein